LARFVLGVERMRAALTLILSIGACEWARESVASAIEVRTELTLGREFAFLTNDLEAELLDGQLALGGGMTMVSDYKLERYGVQALIEYRGTHVSTGVAATFGPRQEQRGWASLDPHAEATLSGARWQLVLDGGVLLRRVDAEARRTRVALGQLQLHAEIEATIDQCWRLAALGLYSFYDPDPAARALRGIDLGLAITLAGKPERWAAGGRVGRRIVKKLWLDLAAVGVEYADGGGRAVVPRVALRAGAWRGVSISASAEVVVDVDAVDGGVRGIGGLALEYER
jgi:hypothetical protein